MTATENEPAAPASEGLTDAELDAMPECIFDDRRFILWQLCQDGRYVMLAARDSLPEHAMCKDLHELRSTIGSVLVPLRVDRRQRDPESALLIDSASRSESVTRQGG